MPADKIREAARLYATSKPAAMFFSTMPLVHQTNGVQNERAVISLVGLTGNFDVRGGNVSEAPSWLHVSGAGFTSREHEFELPRPWSELPPRLGQSRFPVWTEMVDEGQMMDLTRQITSGEPYPLRGLVGFGMNYRLWPGSDKLREALEKLDFIVDVDLFLTDTAKLADIVLPTCSSLERSELRCYPQKYIVYTTPVIEPLGESRSDMDIIYALADKLGLDYLPEGVVVPEGTGATGGTYLDGGLPEFRAGFEASLDWILEPSGMKIEELKKHPAGMFVPDPIRPTYKKYEKNGFNTPSGKMELSSVLLEKHSDYPGIDGLPLYAEPKYSPASAAGEGGRVPLHPERRDAAAHVHPFPHLPSALDPELETGGGRRPQPRRRQGARHRQRRSDRARYPQRLHPRAGESHEHGAAGGRAHVPRLSGGRREHAHRR